MGVSAPPHLAHSTWLCPQAMMSGVRPSASLALMSEATCDSGSSCSSPGAGAPSALTLPSVACEAWQSSVSRMEAMTASWPFSAARCSAVLRWMRVVESTRSGRCARLAAVAWSSPWRAASRKLRQGAAQARVQKGGGLFVLRLASTARGANTRAMRMPAPVASLPPWPAPSVGSAALSTGVCGVAVGGSSGCCRLYAPLALLLPVEAAPPARAEARCLHAAENGSKKSVKCWCCLAAGLLLQELSSAR